MKASASFSLLPLLRGLPVSTRIFFIFSLTSFHRFTFVVFRYIFSIEQRENFRSTHFFVGYSHKGRCKVEKKCFEMIGMEQKDTDFGYTLSLINGKYKLIILYWLGMMEVLRYNELKRKIQIISDKTLRVSLKELEANGLVIRTEYP